MIIAQALPPKVMGKINQIGVDRILRVGSVVATFIGGQGVYINVREEKTFKYLFYIFIVLIVISLIVFVCIFR